MNEAAARNAAEEFEGNLATLLGTTYDAIAASIQAEQHIGPMPGLLRARDELREVAVALERANRDWRVQQRRAAFTVVPTMPLRTPWLQG